MLKYPCLVLDHDDTVVQSMKTLSYPFWCMELELFRPGVTGRLYSGMSSPGLCRDVPGLLSVHGRRIEKGTRNVDGLHPVPHT